MAERLTCTEVRDLAAGYVLDALEPDDALRVAEHLRTCPEPHPEIAELGAVIPFLDETIELVEPPASLRARIMAAAASDLERPGAAPPPVAVVDAAAAPTAAVGAPATAVARPHVTSSTTGAPTAPAVPVASRPAEPIPFPIARHRGSIASWAVGIAAVLAIAALGAWNLMLQQNLSTARLYQDRVTQVLAAGSQPGWRVAVLSAPSGPHGIAALPPSGAGQLIISGLPPTSAGHVYEAWIISNGGAPTPAGWFTVDSSGIGYMDAVRGGSPGQLVVGITLETNPDPPTPPPSGQSSTVFSTGS